MLEPDAGRRYKPRVVQRVEAIDGTVLKSIDAEPVMTLPIRETALKQVQEALVDTVARGTGKKASLRDVSVAGKTGTSQVVTLGKERVPANKLKWNQRDHAWFVAYAPAEDPTIAVATLVEHAPGGGGAVAAPITKQILETYFRLQEAREPAHYAQN